jgi:hypothetical protein
VANPPENRHLHGAARRARETVVWFTFKLVDHKQTLLTNQLLQAMFLISFSFLVSADTTWHVTFAQHTTSSCPPQVIIKSFVPCSVLTRHTPILFHSCLASTLPFRPSSFPRHHISVYTRPALSAPPTSPITVKPPLSSSHSETRWPVHSMEPHSNEVQLNSLPPLVRRRTTARRHPVSASPFGERGPRR